MSEGHRRTLIGVAATLAALFVGGFAPWARLVPGTGPDAPRAAAAPDRGATIGNVATVEAAYERWRRAVERRGDGSRLDVALRFSRARSERFTSASGHARLDLRDGRLSVEVRDLDPAAGYAVWLVDDGVARAAGAWTMRVGALESRAGRERLERRLRLEDLGGYRIDRVVVAAEGADPLRAPLLVGSPSLFQRLYHAGTATPAGRDGTPFSVLVPAPAHAQTGGAAGPDLAALVAQGEDLFLNETFDGNGRTCATCHRPENNFTIDPAFIATLAPDDPLFVAEFDPALADLEKPALMREHGLILANLDGFADPTGQFVMRSVQHLLGLGLSIRTERADAPFDATGWSGDGAPGEGRLRDFATGAVTQHFTRSLDRIEGVDFRLPDPAELDALEAFMLSLGRQEELDLGTMRLADGNAERGRELFLAVDSQNQTVKAAKCDVCHANGGASNAAGVNANFDTGVEDALHPATVAGAVLPRDGGFGIDPDLSTGGFGDGTFNTQSLWEAADTAPFFHNNLSATLEGAIAFYDSPEFRQSRDGQLLISADSGKAELAIEVDALAAFLRAINAVENLRSSRDFLERALLATTSDGSDKLLRLAHADLVDAMEVLAASELHADDAAPEIQLAADLVQTALGASPGPDRDQAVGVALGAIGNARAMIVVVEPEPVGAGTGTSGGTGTGGTGTGGTGTGGTGGTGTPAPDTTKPTVALTAPAQGATVAGSVGVTADASDDTGIAKVIFKVGTTRIGQDATAPYAVTWDTTGFTDGAQTVKAIAVDLAGNRKTASVSVDVLNAPPPVVCSIYGCSGSAPPPPPPPPPPDSGTVSPPPPPLLTGSADSEIQGTVAGRNLAAQTITILGDGGNSVTLQITTATRFQGSFAADLSEVVVGHFVQAAFHLATLEAAQVETDSGL